MAELELRQLKKAYDGTEILHGIDLDIADGEFVVFVGPSGCGKSTMLRCIAGLEEITSGTLKIGGNLVNDVPPSKRSIAMVFQSYALFPHMNVAQNMGFGLRLAGMSAREIEQAVGKAAHILQIEHLLTRKPKDLSGGQRQRVAIGRAIVRKPGVFLFDEPLSNLDAALRVQMRVEIARLHRELKTTMVYVTHDQVEAMTLADRIVVFHQGRIEQVGTPLELYHRPANLFVAGFIGSPNMNLLPVTCHEVGDGHVTVKLMDGQLIDVCAQGDECQSGASMTLGIRPEHIRVTHANAANVIEARVTNTEQLGGVTYLYVNAPGLPSMVVQADPEIELGMGDVIHLYAPKERLHLFDVDGQAVARQSMV